MPEATPKPDDFGWIRVTDKDTGHKRSVQVSELPHGNYTVLKADASDPLTGDPLPPEFNAVKPLSGNTNSGQQADTEKEKANG
jgi:hypothetical protein